MCQLFQRSWQMSVYWHKEKHIDHLVHLLLVDQKATNEYFNDARYFQRIFDAKRKIVSNLHAFSTDKSHNEKFRFVPFFYH